MGEPHRFDAQAYLTARLLALKALSDHSLTLIEIE